MYNLDRVVRMYFSSVPAKKVIEDAIRSDEDLAGIGNESIVYDNFPKDEFLQLAVPYLTHYSDTENRQLYEYIKDGLNEEGHPFAGMKNRSGLNVFAALEELVEQLLILENNEVLCKYNKLLRFREVTKYVEEDLLVCAYWAMRYRKYGIRHSDFGWHVTIGHNNAQLMNIMARGISENHFHLFGSSPSFHFLWIHCMNHVSDPNLLDLVKDIEQRQRVIRQHYNIRYSEDGFAVKILKAALIRVQIVEYLLKDKMGRESQYKKEMGDYLSDKMDISHYLCDIQNMIDEVRNCVFLKEKDELWDYALLGVENLTEMSADKVWFAGERWMMYEMLARELTDEADKAGYKKLFRLFYAYLILKQNFRGELQQVNDTVGFENFSIYNKRKNGCLRNDQMIQSAVYGSVERGNIRFLELRITPDKNDVDNARLIQEIDAVIQAQDDFLEKADYYYVFHFSKKPDEPLVDRDCFDGLHCRHYKLRRELEQRANAIYQFRENYRRLASEVLGIDACAQEIGCRPEVFAPVFRFLSDHVVDPIVGLEDVKVGQLKMTYHVGEDFLDVVDGLRAVDEAVHFLDLQCGDRIGHGIVLGINVRQWYEFKENTIVLAKQDYLDNVVWLYHKLAEYKINGIDGLKEKLLEEFSFYFADIYLRMEDGSSRESFYFDIFTYYEAWKLRGDEPDLYKSGRFDENGVLDWKREYLFNRRYPERFASRTSDEIAYLYYLYHFDWDVRNNGRKSIQKYILPVYIEGVQEVQRAMQKEFGAYGIGVETNPSSNFAISTIRSYEEHPIAVMYNKDMTWDREEMERCPQINVSINTDDKGVFHTSLENEYALMACTMENAQDEKGNLRYNRQMIYQWIDNIRKMGNLQSFHEHKFERQRIRDERDSGENHII